MRSGVSGDMLNSALADIIFMWQWWVEKNPQHAVDLTSLWKVEDRATSLLMRRFYENRLGEYEEERKEHKGGPMSKAEALQEAKLWLRDYTDESGEHPYEHPYFWSAFVLIGDGT